MKKEERITRNVENSKEMKKAIELVGYYSIERFIKDGLKYIKAIKEGRMIVAISNVSKNGGSRDVQFSSCERSKYDPGHFYRNYNALFLAMGYKTSRSSDWKFRICGGGMDMIFYTNYCIIRKLHKLGFISAKECEKLEQMTPTVM